MFTAKVFRIAIASVGTILEENRIAREAIDYWSTRFGEKNGVLLLPTPTDCINVIPDIYVFNIDNYVDAAKVESAVMTGDRVLLFFRQSHNPRNTIMGELNAVEEFKKENGDSVSCFEFNETSDYKRVFIYNLEHCIGIHRI